MSRSWKALSGLVILVVLGGLWTLGRTWLKEASRGDLAISTGTPGGTYILLGEQLLLTTFQRRGGDGLDR